MKQTNKLANLSLEELQKKRSTVKVALIGLLIAYSILIIVMIVLVVKTELYALLATLGGLIPVVIVLTQQYQQLEKEINTRETT